MGYPIDNFRQARLDGADDTWRGTLEEARAAAKEAVVSGTLNGPKYEIGKAR